MSTMVGMCRKRPIRKQDDRKKDKICNSSKEWSCCFQRMHDSLHTAISKLSTNNTQNTLTVVPAVIDSSLAVLITLIALKRPICFFPLSTPVVASANMIQKLTIATKSMRVQLCLRYGKFLRDLSRILLMLSWNGREISSDLSERRMLEKNVDLVGPRRLP
jgi:hypothetical protein